MTRNNRYNNGGDRGPGRNPGGRFGGRFGGRGGRGNGRPFNKHRNEQERGNEMNKKGLSFMYKEPKENKEFKIDLGGTNSEKVKIPLYDDHCRHETMYILIKRFNIMIEDGDLFLKAQEPQLEMKRMFQI